MIDQSQRIHGLVPAHYIEHYPRFIKFFEKYYEWLYRESSLSVEERDLLLTNPDWLQSNTERFMETKQVRHMTSLEDVNKWVVGEFSRIRPPGAVSKRMMDNQLLNRNFVHIITSDGVDIQSNDELSILCPDDDELHIQEWVDDQGFYLPRQELSLHNIDEILFVRLIKSLHLIKGTPKATELFFHLFFDEDIEANNPFNNGPTWATRSSITQIDNIAHKIDHANSQMRDDFFFNEFSYVIYVKNDYSHYMDLFEKFYLPYIHPAGFKAFLQKV